MRISDWSSDVCASDLAATIHKSQGVTVDRAHALATPGMDRHSAYVALSRHRDGVQLHYGRDDFGDDRRLVRTPSRERRSEERRVGKEWGRTCVSRWPPDHSKKTHKWQQEETCK